MKGKAFLIDLGFIILDEQLKMKMGRAKCGRYMGNWNNLVNMMVALAREI